MSALFPRWTNTAARVTVVLALAIPVVALAGLLVVVRGPLVTGQYNPIEQPVQFDHRHHVGGEGIDCRYCHSSVEVSPNAGYPSTAICMNCHSQIWNQSQKLAPVRAAYFSGLPIRWNRVHRLPDFVYFNHSIHVAKGVGCATCHGRIDQQPHVEQVAPMTMRWCLECHRNPEGRLRPASEITSMTWTGEQEPPGAAAERLNANDVRTRVSCTTCHR